jgi:hypothetical protein
VIWLVEGKDRNDKLSLREVSLRACQVPSSMKQVLYGVFDNRHGPFIDTPATMRGEVRPSQAQLQARPDHRFQALWLDPTVNFS